MLGINPEFLTLQRYKAVLTKKIAYKENINQIIVRVIIIQVIAFLPRLKNINEMPSRCPYYVRIKGGFPLAQRGCMLPSLVLKGYQFLWRAVVAGFSRRHTGLSREKRQQKTPSQDRKRAKIFNEWSNDQFGLKVHTALMLAQGVLPFAQGGLTLLPKGVLPFCLKGVLSFCLKGVLPFCLKGSCPFA